VRPGNRGAFFLGERDRQGRGGQKKASKIPTNSPPVRRKKEGLTAFKDPEKGNGGKKIILKRKIEAGVKSNCKM